MAYGSDTLSGTGAGTGTGTGTRVGMKENNIWFLVPV